MRGNKKLVIEKVAQAVQLRAHGRLTEIEPRRRLCHILLCQKDFQKDRTFVFGTYFKGAGGIVVYLPADPRVAALNALGMKNPAFVEELGAANPGRFSASLSFEQSDRIDADLLVMWYGEGTREAAEAQPLFHTIAPVRQGGYVALDDPASVWSTSALSVLSIPYGFPRFVPRLAEAAERVARHRSE